MSDEQSQADEQDYLVMTLEQAAAPDVLNSTVDAVRRNKHLTREPGHGKTVFVRVPTKLILEAQSKRLGPNVTVTQSSQLPALADTSRQLPAVVRQRERSASALEREIGRLQQQVQDLRTDLAAADRARRRQDRVIAELEDRVRLLETTHHNAPGDAIGDAGVRLDV